MTENKDPSGTQDKSRRKKGKGSGFPIWVYIILFLLLLAIPYLSIFPDGVKSITYSTFLKQVQDGHVESVTIIDGTTIEGYYKADSVEEGHISYEISESPFSDAPLWFSDDDDPDKYPFTLTMIEGDEIRAILDEHGVAYDAKVSDNWFSNVFIWFIPLMLIIALWIFIFRRMNPGSQMMNFGKNKASLYDHQSDQKITFKEVAGLQEAKEEVEEIVAFLKDPAKFTKLGGNIPKGVLLVGPPGTGKTMIGKATAGEADVPFFSLSGSDFVEMFVGVGASRVRDLFKQAKEQAPCIIFIDEIDAIGRSRGKNQMSGSNDERENTLNQLLSEMDGFNTGKGVIIMAATNRPDVLDSALMRPGRFDRQILIDKPDLNGRIEILDVHTKKLTVSDNVDFQLLASQTPGFAGAELANLCNEAALLASRRNKEHIEMGDFQDAIERVVAGLEKKNKIISPAEREIIAYHEAGHAIAGWFLEHTDPVLKVSIVPRGFAALGYTLQTPLEDRFLMTTGELDDKICALLGGRVSEEIVFGKISTGARNDLERITQLAYAMVTEYGMSDELGHISYNDMSGDTAPGFGKKYSDITAQKIDQAVQSIINRNYSRTRNLLQEKKKQLISLANALLEKEILDSDDLAELLGKRPADKDENAGGSRPG
ncbi:ATP-dependent zinc metalloprotease FtsH [Natronogracilivirgula saccharolytica]|uniref:ATP-dependent zinc metalloprotease FtsH n=1 Tax=Natronogracilivirga saccharolytica TaxID=2812953 RepID=A0A8J7RJ82_9BACT|nr:ATP-dependent zinc metalloprotease FtsH [Natronogracilivirga saccharolytica]MBP3192232.1 ATP-dependent zinc metalloprotease FtsH [Natronogracilivirga saccharolytica]